MSLTGKTLAQMWPNWCHQLCRKNSRFHVQKLWPHCHFVKWPPKNRVLFWGWNVKIWWPAHRKNNKTNGNETQTWQKDMKSIAKRKTTQNPQTSKRATPPRSITHPAGWLWFPHSYFMQAVSREMHYIAKYTCIIMYMYTVYCICIL